jgi:hypothetical protein
MAWTPYIDYSGQKWAVNRDALYSLIRAKVHAQTVLRRTRPTYGKTLCIHDIHDELRVNKVETNWNGFAQELDQKSRAEFLDLEETIVRANAETMVARISDIRADTAAAITKTTDMQRRFCRNVMGELHQEQVVLEGMTTGLRLLRDGAAAAAIVISGAAFAAAIAGGTVLAGGVITGVSTGTAYGLLGVGSVAKGVAEWTETGSIGAGILEASGNAIVGVIGFGAAGVGVGAVAKESAESLKKTAKVVVIVVGSAADAFNESYKAMASGKSGADAAKRAMARFGTSLATGIALECEKVPLWGKVTANFGSDQIVGNLNKITNYISGPRTGELLPSEDSPELLSGHAQFLNIPKVGMRRPPPYVKGTITYAAELSSCMTDEDFVRAAILKRVR